VYRHGALQLAHPFAVRDVDTRRALLDQASVYLGHEVGGVG